MAQAGEPLFHQRRCVATPCGAPFWICQSCYRGQRYCCERCRLKNRRQQRREANRRHQQSPEGRLDHRDRQRAYRLRRARARVTDHTRTAPSSSARIGRPDPLLQSTMAGTETQPEEELHAGKAVTDGYRRWSAPGVHCLVCGRWGTFVDPFRRGG